jgi:hypothetical protein
MSAQARGSRAEERRLSIRTLAIASASSAIAAIVTSRLWAAGTPIAAAMTPVLVTIVSEMLHRPTAKIVERFTVETDALPEAMGAGAPPPRVREQDPEPVPEQPLRDLPAGGQSSGEPPNGVRIYRSGAGTRPLPWKLIAATAALAFLIGVVVLTVPRVIAGQSLLEGSPPGYGSASNEKDKSAPAEDDGRQAPAQPEQEPATAAPESTTTTEEPDPETAPESIAPAPEKEPPADAPAPKTAPQTTPPPVPQQQSAPQP